MRTRLLLAATATLTLVACTDSSTAPRLSPTDATREITCRSGYHIATREDGSESCEPDSDALYGEPGGAPASGNAPVTPVAPPVVAPPVATPPVPTPAAATPPATSE